MEIKHSQNLPSVSENISDSTETRQTH